MKRLAVLFVALGAAIFCCGISQAALINVDFGTGGGYSGLAMYAGGATSDTWNVATTSSVTEANALSLVDAANQSTGVAMYYGGAAGIYNWSGTTNLLMKDYLYTDNPVGNSLSVYLTGLAEGTYDLYVYSQGDSGCGYRTTTFTAGGQTLSVGPTAYNYAEFNEGENSGVLQGVTVGNDGLLTITATNASTGSNPRGMLNGFQLTEVPEPGSIVLAVVGMVVLVVLPGCRRYLGQLSC